MAGNNTRNTSLLQDIITASTSKGQWPPSSSSEGCAHEPCFLPAQRLSAAWCCGSTRMSEDSSVPLGSGRLEDNSFDVNMLHRSRAADIRIGHDCGQQPNCSSAKSVELIASPPTNAVPYEYNDYAMSHDHQQGEPAQVSAGDRDLTFHFSGGAAELEPCSIGSSGPQSATHDRSREQTASLKRDDVPLLRKAFESKFRPEQNLDQCIYALADRESTFSSQKVNSIHMSPMPSAAAHSTFLVPHRHAMASQNHANTVVEDASRLQGTRAEEMPPTSGRSHRGSSLLRTKLNQELSLRAEQRPASGMKTTARATSNLFRGSNYTKRRTRGNDDPEGQHQRMTHIVVERNRRKQMNQHLASLKALMPITYVQKSDQASVIGAAAEFVKELEMLSESLQSTLKRRACAQVLDQSKAILVDPGASSSSEHPPKDYLTCHQNTFCSLPVISSGVDELASHNHSTGAEHLAHSMIPELKAESTTAAATIEVKTVGSNAIINIVTQWRPKQLVQVIAAIEDLFLTILHANVTTYKDMVLYTFNVQMESKSEMPVEQTVIALQKTFKLLHYMPS